MKKVSNSIDKIINNESIYLFFKKYKLIIISSILLGIYANSIDIFTIKYGIDAERFALDPQGNLFFDQQRYGSYVLLHLLPFLKHHIVSQITGIVAIVFAALLTISRHNIPIYIKAIFCITLVTFPNFAFLEFFYFQSVYNFISLLLVVIAYRITEYAINKQTSLLIAPIFILAFAISSYHALFAVYLTVMMINVMLDFITDNDIKKAIKYIVIGMIVAALSMAVYYISILIIHSGNFYHYGKYDTYHETNIIKYISSISYYIFNTLTSKGHYGNHLFTLPITIAYVITMILYFIRIKNIKHTIFYLILTIGCILATFSISILIGDRVPSRGSLAVAFLYSYFCIFVILVLKLKLTKLFAIILFIIGICFHITYITEYDTMAYLQYEEDKRIAANLIDSIYEVAPNLYDKKYQILFNGRIHLYHSQRPLIKRGKDIFGSSIFSWDKGNPRRMIYFMYLMGLPTNVQVYNKKDIIIENNMPIWPAKGSVKLEKDIIIVNLQKR